MVIAFPQLTTSVSLKVTLGAAQSSVAVAVPVLAGDVSSVHSTVVSAGMVNIGSTVSIIEYVAVVVDALPQSSVAVKVTVMAPLAQSTLVLEP